MPPLYHQETRRESGVKKNIIMSWRAMASSAIAGGALTYATTWYVLRDSSATPQDTQAPPSGATTATAPRFSDIRSKFDRFATTERSGERLMSFSDFLSSLAIDSRLAEEIEKHRRAPFAISPKASSVAKDAPERSSTVPSETSCISLTEWLFGGKPQPPPPTASAQRQADPTVAAYGRLEAIFRGFDISGDGFLSYEEYCSLSALLGTPPAVLQKAFRLFAEAATGASGKPEEYISPRQFRRMLSGLVDDADLVEKMLGTGSDANSLTRAVFIAASRQHKTTAADADKLTFDELVEFVTRTETELVRWAFRAADRKGQGGLSLRAFRRLVFQQQQPAAVTPPTAPAPAAAPTATLGQEAVPTANGESDLTPPLVKQIVRAAPRAPNRQSNPSRPAQPQRVVGYDADDLVNVMQLLKQSEDWVAPLHLYSRHNDQPIDKPALYRAFRAANMTDVTARTSNLIFDIFDADGSGTLTMDEVDSVLASKTSWFVTHQRSFTEPERNWVQRWAKCMQQQ